MDEQFTWIPFYMEFADKLKAYSENRSQLINIITSVYNKLAISMPTLEKGGMSLVDIDPFTVFGLFNKGIKDTNRIAIIKEFADKFAVSSPAPADFNGIPVMNPLQAAFYGFGDDRNEEDIDNLWGLFNAALDYADNGTNREDFCKYFNLAIKQYCVKLASLTMGLFWIRPYKYLNFDGNNQSLLRDDQLTPAKVVDYINRNMIKRKNYNSRPDANTYLQVCELCHDELQSSDFEYKDFPSLSHFAWKLSKGTDEKSEWFPSLDEYDPGLTTDDWLDLLNDKNVFDEKSLNVIKLIYDMGGNATCKELSDKYGDTPQHYNSIATSLAKRIIKVTNLPNYNVTESKYWPVLFVGKPEENKESGTYRWKLRDELKSALETFLNENPTENIPATWLLNYNPNKWDWEKQNDAYSYKDTLKTVKNGGAVFFSWRCHSNQVKAGDRVFIIKLGPAPRGIFATGYASSEPYEGTYTDDNGQDVNGRMIDICITGFLDYHTEELISQDMLKRKFPQQQWSPQGSGISVKSDAAQWLIENWNNSDTKKVMPDNPKEDILPTSNSEFLKYFAPLIQALKELGGSAARKDAHKKVVELMGISEEELSITYEKTGESRVLNQIDFARNDLAHEGFISSGTKGIWALTELRTSIEMTPELAGLIHMKWVKINTAKRKGEPISDIDLSKYYKKKADHKYTKENFIKDVFITEPEYDKLSLLLLKKKNIILQGAPGVGKTFSAKRLAYSIIGEKNENRICMVQFHQNYSYEDFIMGYRPAEDGSFELRSGVFYNFCERCKENPDKPYFFIIDEINRGNLSKIFGELLMLIETDKRGEEHRVNLVYGGTSFYIPDNLHIIGMMNTADRSLAMIDYALRRCFSFYTMKPAFENADNNGFGGYMKQIDCKLYHTAVSKIRELNNTIHNDSSLGKGFEIGHSYFAPEDVSVIDDAWVHNVIEYEIIPLIEEYWFDDDKKTSDWTKALFHSIGEEYDG